MVCFTFCSWTRFAGVSSAARYLGLLKAAGAEGCSEICKDFIVHIYFSNLKIFFIHLFKYFFFLEIRCTFSSLNCSVLVNTSAEVRAMGP